MYIIEQKYIDKAIRDASRFTQYKKINFILEDEDSIERQLINYTEFNTCVEHYIRNKLAYIKSEHNLLKIALEQMFKTDIDDEWVGQCNKEMVISGYISMLIKNKLDKVESKIRDQKKFIFNEFMEE